MEEVRVRYGGRRDDYDPLDFWAEESLHRAKPA